MTDFLKKAAALSAAWQHLTSAPPPTRIAILYPLAQAELETQDGDAWGGVTGPHNWGALDYRAPNAAELMAIKAGALRTGAWLYSNGTYGTEHRADSVAQLHLDSHPGGGSYSMWFAAFPDDVAGAMAFLKLVLRMVGVLLDNPESTVAAYATAVYLRGYYEGRHPGARPIGKRAPPLNKAEFQNIADYVAGMQSVLPGLERALAGWPLPGESAPDDTPTQPSIPPIVHPDLAEEDLETSPGELPPVKDA